MTRILGLQGSPRRGGNTDILLTHVLDGATEAGAETDRLDLADMTIRECDGCVACWKTGVCVKADDMCEAYPRIAAADAVVFGTPLYWYGPTALMKAFIDRFVYFNCDATRVQIEGTRAAVVVPLEEEAGAADLLMATFAKCFKYVRMPFAARLVASGLGPKGAALEQPEFLEQARALGRELAAG